MCDDLKRLLLAAIVFFICVSPRLLGATITDNGDGTSYDDATYLTWQTEESLDDYQWKTALKYCEDLTFAGKSDWRLPSKTELESLVDDTKYDPAILSPLTGTGSWTSTHYPGNAYYAYTVYFTAGATTRPYTDGHAKVRCVRGGAYTSAPLVSSISPSELLPSQHDVLIEITGKNFTNSDSPPQVKAVGEKCVLSGQDADGWAAATYMDSSHISVQISQFLVAHGEKIDFIVRNSNGEQDVVADAITLKLPVIDSITPQIAYVGDKNTDVTIKGKNFYALDSNYPQVFLEGAGSDENSDAFFIPAKLLSDTEIVFTVPSINNVFEKNRIISIVFGVVDDEFVLSENEIFLIPNSVNAIVPSVSILLGE